MDLELKQVDLEDKLVPLEINKILQVLVNNQIHLALEEVLDNLKFKINSHQHLVIQVLSDQMLKYNNQIYSEVASEEEQVALGNKVVLTSHKMHLDLAEILVRNLNLN